MTCTGNLSQCGIVHWVDEEIRSCSVSLGQGYCVDGAHAEHRSMCCATSSTISQSDPTPSPSNTYA